MKKFLLILVLSVIALTGCDLGDMLTPGLGPAVSPYGSFDISFFIEEEDTNLIGIQNQTIEVTAAVVTDSYARILINGESATINISSSHQYTNGLQVKVLDTIIDDDYADVVELRVWND